MIWYFVIPNDFYMFVYRPDNYVMLNKLKLKFQEAVDIVRCFTGNSNAFL